MMERVYFALCLAFGRLLRSVKYSTALPGEARLVRKHRRFYAPVLVWLGALLVKILDTGVRVLSQHEWEERERDIYPKLYGAAVAVDAGGVLMLPQLTGRTLASLLDDRAVSDGDREKAITLAVRALHAFHTLGYTHADAMAENVLVDLPSGAAHWFDFETVHDPNRPMTWRRADDLRALLTTCLIRTDPVRRAATLGLVLNTYGDEGVARDVAAAFSPVVRRSLSYHLAQAPMTFDEFRDLAAALTTTSSSRARSTTSPPASSRG
jgi:hypothetical protein